MANTSILSEKTADVARSVPGVVSPSFLTFITDAPKACSEMGSNALDVISSTVKIVAAESSKACDKIGEAFGYPTTDQDQADKDNEITKEDWKNFDRCLCASTSFAMHAAASIVPSPSQPFVALCAVSNGAYITTTLCCEKKDALKITSIVPTVWNKSLDVAKECGSVITECAHASLINIASKDKEGCFATVTSCLGELCGVFVSNMVDLDKKLDELDAPFTKTLKRE